VTADRVTHDAVRTVDATVERAGPVDRPRVALPADEADAVPVDRVVRLLLDGTEYRTRPSRVGDAVVLSGAYDTPAGARDPGDATDRLGSWVAAHDLDYGRTVHLDVVTEGRRYGLRAPGASATYDAHEGPDASLAAIADRVQRDG